MDEGLTYASAKPADYPDLLRLNLEVLHANYKAFRSSDFIDARDLKIKNRLGDLVERKELSPEDLVERKELSPEDLVERKELSPKDLETNSRLTPSELATLQNTRIARLKGELVGYITTQRYPSSTFIKQLKIRPQYQGRGLGRKLINELSGPLILEVHLENQSARTFYAKLGFEELQLQNLGFEITDEISEMLKTWIPMLRGLNLTLNAKKYIVDELLKIES